MDTGGDNFLRLQQQLVALRERALAFEQSHFQSESPLHPSAQNLLHYLSVRQQDIRDLQWQLLQQGITSLSDLGPYTMARLNSVIDVLGRLTATDPLCPDVPVDFVSGPKLLQKNATQLLGPGTDAGHDRIMVTMPSVAATDGKLVSDLLRAGMTVMRVNCAHDDCEAWQAMADHLHNAEKSAHQPCKIQADLGGPKLRTGPIEASGRVIKFKPQRDLYGRVVEPCRVHLCSEPGNRLKESNQLVLEKGFLSQCWVGDQIQLEDSRGQKRQWEVVSSEAGYVVVEFRQTTYVADGTRLRLTRWGNVVAETECQQVPDVVMPLQLRRDELLILTREPLPGRHGIGNQHSTQAPRIHCTLPQVFDQAQPGHRVWFDDGKIGGVVEYCQAGEMGVRITQAADSGSKLRAEKGINFPDTPLNIPALTDKDIQDLSAVVQWADIIGLSFVNTARDVQLLHDRLQALDKPNIGIVVKIENQRAFKNLPDILLKGISLGRPFGVMIARGDLAVEVGFERLSEVQQEILWLCEAAHVPVVWATQILESMAKRGLPSRAEVSDAGMGVFAECAMLNKGPYILDTVRLLKGILSRMDSHYQKRRATLRKLTVAEFDPPA